MFGLAKLSRSREIDSLHALGFSWLQLLTPIMGLTAIVMVFVFLILGWLQPLSIYYSKVFAHDIEQSSSLVSDGIDMFVVDGPKTILIDDISRDGNLFSRVFIYETFKDAKTVTTAGSKGQLVGEGGLANQSYSVNSVDVMEVKYDAQNKPLSSSTVTRSYNVQGPLRQFGQEAFRLRGASEFEWTMSELFQPGPVLSKFVEMNKRNAEVNYRFAQLLFILLLPFVAVVTIIEPRRNPGPFRFLVGLLIVLGFNQYLSMATSFSRDAILPPSISIWLPFTVVASCVFYKFYLLTSKPAARTAR
jgi:lipopolysaccharide export system permease protein